MGYSQACDIIIRGKGTQFDPHIVDAFENIKDKLIEQYESLFKIKEKQTGNK
jgi:response regulator RpfG family c-di-GMP phosphodiesterase